MNPLIRYITRPPRPRVPSLGVVVVETIGALCVFVLPFVMMFGGPQ